MDSMIFNDVEKKILMIRDIEVILDSDIAMLYGVETKRINEAVSNNPEKFPYGYVICLEQVEWDSLRSKFSTLKTASRGKYVKYLPKVFTEKGLYMLATILKSPQATQTTIAIIEAFAKIKNLSRNMRELATINDESAKQALLKKSGEIITEIFDDGLVSNETETSIELNFAILKFKHTLKKKKLDE